ncbi:MAG: Fic family protein [Desulfovibrio sp.]|nr:Fic family protein [Desulfovibrio sp.]
MIPKERIAWIGWGGKRPKTDHEREVLDLRDALAEVCCRHGEMDVDPQTLRSLHRTAARTGALRGAGRFRLGKARLAEEWPGHQGMAKLETLAAEELPFAVERLCLAWTEASRRESVDGIMLAAAAAADFVCMAPFAWGMGRMSRLLTTLLLCKAGVDPIACAFTTISLHNAEEDYADALVASCQGWREGTGDPHALCHISALERPRRLRNLRGRGCRAGGAAGAAGALSAKVAGALSAKAEAGPAGRLTALWPGPVQAGQAGTGRDWQETRGYRAARSSRFSGSCAPFGPFRAFRVLRGPFRGVRASAWQARPVAGALRPHCAFAPCRACAWTSRLSFLA